MKKVTEKDVQIDIFVTYENDLDYTKEYETDIALAIEEMIEKYGLWGFCCVEVRVTFDDLEASDYLGACSYKGENDFVQNSGYYTDMVSTAIDQINEQLEDRQYSVLQATEIAELINAIRDKLKREKQTITVKGALQTLKNLKDLIGG